MADETPIYMTPSCAEQMRRELKDLLYDKRPDTVRRVADAAAEGDRSENAEYIYGKRYLRKIDSRIHFLTKRIENADDAHHGRIASSLDAHLDVLRGHWAAHYQSPPGPPRGPAVRDRLPGDPSDPGA